ncbi:Holliday junction ATP-dependent DNA helicase RuvB protein [Candidatus Micropelagos thuwalensis]|uniref:Holliday junction ATP-dependent DNA helicase RuvB protein n=1 Tax=Candidatus Micropelagius thuwalensis TaxID=1397666 RepID=U2XM34_9PROT|nr:hypothetical protein [Candidatus Micropelagos thuwalensis]ERL46177.1 Holliday junction ATP-dependent DNA helicase RuvB protein [Candidatus Micropelagos thuwalensis]
MGGGKDGIGAAIVKLGGSDLSNVHKAFFLIKLLSQINSARCPHVSMLLQHDVQTYGDEIIAVVGDSFYL